MWSLIGLVGLVALLGCSPPPADLVLLDGNVYTVTEDQPWAQAVAIRGKQIVFVGSNQESQPYQAPQTKVVQLGGQTVVPGFADSHVHLSGIGRREMMLDLEDAGSLEQLVTKVREEAERVEPGEWIVGRGWIEAQWDAPVFPSRWDLDAVSPLNPVWLVRRDGHAGLANSLALRVAGINKATREIDGGEILRQPQSREPTGMLLDRAMRLIQNFLPKETAKTIRQAILMGVRRMLEHGWTELGIAGNTYEEIEIIRELYEKGEIQLRIYDAVRGPGEDADRLLAEGAVRGAHDGLFTVRAIKVVADGALGSKGAALFEKYSDHDSRGLLLWKEGDLLPLFERALREGIQVQTHAIGDRANHFVLNLYEKAFQNVPPAERPVPDPRWRIEHAQMVRPDELPRFAQLKVIPSMQASHAISDLYFAKNRLGVERLAGAYAWRSFIEAGSIIAGGSDAPVEKGDPMIEFYAAVARKDLAGRWQDHWHREQTLSRQEALKMLTAWPAYATFQEDQRGTIEPGKWADLTVLSRDIMTIPEAGILKTECTMTIVAGEIVYRN